MTLNKKHTVNTSDISRWMLTIIEYVWAVTVVLNGNTVYHASAKSYYLLELCVVMTWVLAAAEISLRKLSIGKWQGLVAIASIAYSGVYLALRYSAVAVGDFTLLFLMGLPVLVLLFSALHGSGLLKQLLCKLFQVVFVLALISLYYWIWGVQLGKLQPNMSMAVNWGSFKQVAGYDGLHFAFQLDTTFFPNRFIYRNSGIFAEAPMFNLWLDMSLAGELFLRERISKIRVVVYVVTILTTLSMTGVLFIVLCFAMYLISIYPPMSRRLRIAMTVIGALALPVALYAVLQAMELKSGTQSYQMRLSDYVAGVRLWWDYPILGGGYGNLAALLPYMYSPDGLLGFSNSLTGVLGTGGAWMTLLFYIPHFGVLFPRLSGEKRLSCFGVCYLYLFCTTAFFVRYIAVVMAAVGFAFLLKPKNAHEY